MTKISPFLVGLVVRNTVVKDWTGDYLAHNRADFLFPDGESYSTKMKRIITTDDFAEVMNDVATLGDVEVLASIVKSVFVWEVSPEGYHFWCNLYRAMVPFSTLTAD